MKHINRIQTVLFLLLVLLFFRLPAAKAAPGAAWSTHPDREITPEQITPGAATDDFVITVKTDNSGSSSSTQFTVPTSGSGYNYNVDCNNDGTFELTGVTGNYTCDYGPTGLNTGVGIYTVRIQDNNGDLTGFPRIYFHGGGDRQKLLTIQQWGKGKWTSMNAAFEDCSNLTLAANDVPDLSGVTNLSLMFDGASAFNGNIATWDTSHVTDMNDMFAFDSAFNQNIGSWNTSSVTKMFGMFYQGNAFNGNIGNWNTGMVTDMSEMFFGASAFNQNIGSWDTSKVNDMSLMFVNAKAFNQNIGGWNTSRVTDMSSMFVGASAFNQNIGGWKVAGLAHADSMFSGMKLATPNYDALLQGWDAQTLHTSVNFDGGNSQYCAGAAARAHLIGTDGWSIRDGGKDCPADDFVITVKTDNPGTSGSAQFTIPTSGSGYNYNVDCKNDGIFEASAQTGNYTCNYGTAGTYTVRIQDNNGDLTGFPRIYFYDGGDCQKLLTIQQWGKGKWTSMNAAFEGCSYLTLAASDAPDLSGVTDLSFMFAYASAFNGSIGSWNTSQGIYMTDMFAYDSAFNQNIGSWNTSSVTDMRGMFYQASSFNQNIGNWNTGSLTNMPEMFYGGQRFQPGYWQVEYQQCK